MNTTTQKRNLPKNLSSWAHVLAHAASQKKARSDLRSARLAVLRAALVGNMEQFSAAAYRYREAHGRARKVQVLTKLDIAAKRPKRQTLLEEF